MAREREVGDGDVGDVEGEGPVQEPEVVWTFRVQEETYEYWMAVGTPTLCLVSL